ncbi:pentraxin fusion protein-like [Discoglossus pictus]
MGLKAFTICMKLSTDGINDQETILFSYRTLFYDELNLWIEKEGHIGFYMSGEGVKFIPMDTSREWNHLCLTWESKHGRSEIWINGRRSGLRIYQKKHTVRPNGIVLLGQDQDSFGGSFDRSQSFVGKIKDLNMWDSVLSLKTFRKLFKGKEIQKGNVFDWRSLSYEIHGNVNIA